MKKTTLRKPLFVPDLYELQVAWKALPRVGAEAEIIRFMEAFDPAFAFAPGDLYGHCRMMGHGLVGIKAAILRLTVDRILDTDPRKRIVRGRKFPGTLVGTLEGHEN